MRGETASFRNPSAGVRRLLKRGLALPRSVAGADGMTMLIYHRVGGGTTNELDLTPATFARHVALLSAHEVLSLDAALDRLDAGDARPSFVLTFDDGFADVYEHAWPLLRERGIPFTIYLAAAYVGTVMRWEGATARGVPGRGLTWAQLGELLESGLCTIGNHTYSHARPEALTVAEVDRCTEEIERHLGVTPRHFTYPWGVAVDAVEPALRARFRSSSTGRLGRNLPGTDLHRLSRVPVRRTDPDAFFRAKLLGNLEAERAYAAVVDLAKAARRQLPTRRR